MEKAVNAHLVKRKLKYFIEWESQSYENWKSIDDFVGDTLSDAWIMARPYDKDKFLDEDFKNMVDSANGKWLEKADSTDSYKIILSRKYARSIQALISCLVHELRHCLDYQNAVKFLTFDKYHLGNDYYNSCSEFKAVYSQIRYEFFVMSHNNDDKDGFDILTELLGRYTADVMAGLLRAEIIIMIHCIFCRYLGASRAIRNISIEESIDSEIFYTWKMTPQYIIDHYGYVFYIRNEWIK